MRILSNSYIDNKTKLSMQFLADIMKNMSYKKLITKKDLYELSEKEVIEKLRFLIYLLILVGLQLLVCLLELMLRMLILLVV